VEPLDGTVEKSANRLGAGVKGLQESDPRPGV
jgi:hypothetical protein